MDSSHAGHPWSVQRALTLRARDQGETSGVVASVEGSADFTALYEAHFAFVWRSARRLGVPEDGLDDVVQDVFVTAYRRRDSFEGRSKPSTWLFGILRRVVAERRRSQSRKPTESLREEPAAPGTDGPLRAVEQSRAHALVYTVLGTLDPPFREVLILADLEQMSAPDIAEALELNLNTVYSRLRTARQRFEAALKRHTARTQPQPPRRTS